MKAGFSLEQRYVPTWNGNAELNAADQMVAVLKMPTVQDLFTVIDTLSRNGVGATEDSAKLGMARNTAIANEAGTYVTKYVTLQNAEDFTLEQVVTYPPYFGLAVELLFAIIKFAQPNEDEEKN